MISANRIQIFQHETRGHTKKNSLDVAPQTTAITTLEQKQNLSVVKREQFVKLNIFEKNSIVLAKQKYSCPWPARVLEIEKNKVLVFFFDDKRNGFVSRFEIYDFLKSSRAIKSIITSKRVPRCYLTGVSEIELLLGINKEQSILNDL